MAYNTARHPVQLTHEDRAATLAHVLATVPAEGRVLTGYIAGISCATAKNQREAYRKALARELRAKRKAVAAEVEVAA